MTSPRKPKKTDTSIKRPNFALVESSELELLYDGEVYEEEEEDVGPEGISATASVSIEVVVNVVGIELVNVSVNTLKSEAVPVAVLSEISVVVTVIVFVAR